MINTIKKHIFNERFSKFFLIGIWNAAFGVGVFSLLYYWFHQYVNYMILVIITNILAITNAYICYKLVVFKTKGNYVKEYLRFYIVYGFAFAVSLLLFPLFMEVVFPFLAAHMPNYYGIFNYKAYLSQLVITSITMFVSYFGHLKVSFREEASSEVLPDGEG